MSTEAEIQSVVEANGLTGAEPELIAFAQANIGKGWEAVKDEYTAIAESLKPKPPGDLETPVAPTPADPVAEAKARHQAAFETEAAQINRRESLGGEDLYGKVQEMKAEMQAEMWGPGATRLSMPQRMALYERKHAEFAETYGVDARVVDFDGQPSRAERFSQPEHPVAGRSVIKVQDPRQSTDE